MNCRFKLMVVLVCLSSALYGCAGHSPARVSDVDDKYGNVSRGSYRGSYYEVQKGDTLYFISYVTNKDVKEIIQLNKLKSPYTIHPGQRLNLWRPVYSPPVYAGSGAGDEVAVASAATVATAATAAGASPAAAPKSTKQKSIKTETAQKTAKKSVDQSKPKEYGGSKGKQNVNKSKPAPIKAKSTSSSTKVASWKWPTKGRVIKNFSAGDQGNKGIDIAGQRGQAIVATAGGTVVYSGNALRGYGNLVIVKHNDNYLSAYAHNDRLLVSEGQSIHSGQKIATMGSSGTNTVKLHFEIRYQGKSVNPKRYLP